MEVAYRKDEVWLAEWCGMLQELTIKEISGPYVRHDFAWETAEAWHKRAKQKVGTVRRIWSVKVGVKR